METIAANEFSDEMNNINMSGLASAMSDGASALKSSAEANERIFEKFTVIMQEQSKKHTDETEKLSRKIEENTNIVREMLQEMHAGGMRIDNIEKSVKSIFEEQCLQRKQLHLCETRLVKVETLMSKSDEHSSKRWDIFFKTGGWIVALIAMIGAIYKVST